MFKTTTYFIITIAFTLTSLAGVKLEYNHYEGGDKSKKEKNRVIMTENEMLIENNSSEGKVTMIYNSEADKITIVSHSNEMYMVINKKKLESMKKQISSMMDQVKQQLANLPDAQRKQMEKMYEKQMGGMTKVEYSISKTGNAKKINGWNTSKYELKADGVVTSEIWASDFSEIGIDEKDFVIMKDFSAFSTSMLDALPNATKDPFSAIYDEFKGVPVKTIQKTTNTITELTNVENHIGSINYKIPDGYTEQSGNIPGNR